MSSVLSNDSDSSPDLSARASRPRRKTANYNADLTHLLRERRDPLFENEKGYSAFGRRRPAGQRWHKDGTKNPNEQKKKPKDVRKKSVSVTCTSNQKNNLFHFWGKPKTKSVRLSSLISAHRPTVEL